MMKSFLILATLGLSASLATEAAAMNGRDALASCTSNPGCRALVVADGGVVITVGGHTIYCPPQNGDCEMVYRRGGKSLMDAPLATADGATAAPKIIRVSPETLLKN